MQGFNRGELKALLTATGLLALGVSARLGLAPPPSTFEWHGSDSTGGGIEDLRDDVRRGLLREQRAARPLAEGERLNPNTAPVEELRRLPGIGPARAAAIVDERLRNGAFHSLSDLGRVPGFGPALLGRLTPHLALPAAPRVDLPPAASTAPPVPYGTGPRRRVDLNRAQINDLEQITGIGPVLARRIVETRNRLGGFRRVEDLLEVPGIGPRKLQRIRDQVRLR